MYIYGGGVVVGIVVVYLLVAFCRVNHVNPYFHHNKGEASGCEAYIYIDTVKQTVKMKKD